MLDEKWYSIYTMQHFIDRHVGRNIQTLPLAAFQYSIRFVAYVMLIPGLQTVETACCSILRVREAAWLYQSMPAHGPGSERRYSALVT